MHMVSRRSPLGLSLHKLAIAAVGATLGAVAPASSAALVIQLDSFYIERNGIQQTLDTFSDGVAPPNGPAGATTYSTSGTFSEAGGRAIMNSAFGVPGSTPQN